MTPSLSSSSTMDVEEPRETTPKTEMAPTSQTDSQPIEQGQDPFELPYQTLTDNADMGEYTNETISGTRLREIHSNKTGEIERYELVTFTLDDKENPKNWSKEFKWWCTMTVALTCFAVAFNSAVITSDLTGPAATFNVSQEVVLVTITVFVVGFGVGPVAFAPLSESFGRRPLYASTLLVAVIFVIPCAVAKNIGTLIVCRAIDGIA